MMKKSVYTPASGASDLVDQEHAVAGLTNLNDLDNPSVASTEQSCDEAAETKNVLETTKPKPRNSRKLNQSDSRKSYSTQTTQSQMQIPI